MDTSTPLVPIIGCVHHLSFPYPIDVKRTMDHFREGVRSIVLTTIPSTVVHYHVVSNVVYDETLNHSFSQRVRYLSTHTYIPTVYYSWFGGEEHNVSVFFYMTSPLVAYQDTRITVHMLRQFSKVLRTLLKTQWVPDPTTDLRQSISIVMDPQKDPYMTWSLSSLVKSTRVARNTFIDQWNRYLEHMNPLLRIRSWYRSDIKEIQEGEIHHPRYRKMCHDAVYTDIGELQDWVKSYISQLANLVHRDCEPALSITIHGKEGIVFWDDSTGHQIETKEAMDDIMHKLNNTHDTKCRMLSIPISFHSYDYAHGHLVMLYLETQEEYSSQRTALWFDPNGEEYDVWTNILDQDTYVDLFVELHQRFDQIGYRIVHTTNKCLNRHQNSSRTCTRVIRDQGYCMWISYYAMLTSMVHERSPTQVIESLNEQSSHDREVTIESFIGWLISKYNRSGTNAPYNTYRERQRISARTISRLLQKRQLQMTSFETAVREVKELKRLPQKTELLELYALYKQGTVGDIRGKRPGRLFVKKRAKYDAWLKKRGLNTSLAKEQYIHYVTILKHKYG